jgi:hypothetical protein
MHIDQTGILVRPPLASLRSEDAAEREWARLDGILSGESGAGLTGQLAKPRRFAMLPNRKIAALGFLGFLGGSGALLFPVEAPSLGIAIKNSVSSSPVSIAEAAQPLAITAVPSTDVQSGRSTITVPTPRASIPIPVPRSRAVTVRTRQPRSVVATRTPRESRPPDYWVKTDANRTVITTRRYGSRQSFRDYRRIRRLSHATSANHFSFR